MNRSLLALLQVCAALGISLGCYLVSAHVNAEHGAIDRLTRTIAQERRAVTMLGTLYDARRAMPQVQRWSDADATRLMSAPAPEQMLANSTQLAVYIPGRGDAVTTQAVVPDAVASPVPPVRVAGPALAPAPAARRPVLIASEIAVPHAPASARARESAEGAGRERGKPPPAITSPSRVDLSSTRAAIGARVPARETPDLAALTRDIGRELQASETSDVRPVSLR